MALLPKIFPPFPSLETFILSSVSLKKDKLSKILHSLSGLPKLFIFGFIRMRNIEDPGRNVGSCPFKVSLNLGITSSRISRLSSTNYPKLESLSIWGNPFFKGESNQSHEDFPPFDESQTDWPELDFSLWEEPEEAELKGRSRELLDKLPRILRVRWY